MRLDILRKSSRDSGEVLTLVSCWLIAGCFLQTFLEVLVGAQLQLLQSCWVRWCLCSDFFFFFFLVLTPGPFTIRDCLKSFCGQSRSTIKHTGGNCLGWGDTSYGRSCAASLPLALPRSSCEGCAAFTPSVGNLSRHILEWEFAKC